MSKIICCLCLIFVFCLDLSSQEMKLYFKNMNRSSSEFIWKILPVKKLSYDTLVSRISENSPDSIIYPIKLPKIKNFNDTTFFTIDFKGQKKGAEDFGINVLYANYKSDNAYIYVDENNNLDFTDDNNFQTITKNQNEFQVNLRNSKNPNGYMSYLFRKAIYDDSSMYKNLKKHYANTNPEKGITTIDMEYWLEHKRLNILSCDTILDGQKIQMGLMDWECNGLYNDIDTLNQSYNSSDRILLGKYGSDIISDSPSAGASPLSQETLIPINGLIYEILEVEATGKYIRIRKTDKEYTILRVGDDVPNLEFSLMDESPTKLTDHIIKGKYNLIDIWAFWCKGCVLAFPKIKELLAKYPNKLNVISLHDEDSYEPRANKIIQKYDDSWTFGISNVKLERTILSNGGYPYYVLISPGGKISNFDIETRELEEILANAK